MAMGHRLGAELAHGFAAAAHKDGQELVGISLDAIWVVGHHQAAALAAGRGADRILSWMEGQHQWPGLILVARMLCGTLGSPERCSGASGWGGETDL